MLALHFDGPARRSWGRGAQPEHRDRDGTDASDSTLEQRQAYDGMPVRPASWFLEQINTAFAQIA